MSVLARTVNWVRGIVEDERGLTGVEYAVLLVFFAVVMAAGVYTFGTNVSGLFNNVAGSLGPQTLPPVP